MMNLYKIAEKVILINPFGPPPNPHIKLSYTALFSHTMTLKERPPDDPDAGSNWNL